jgi:hypothetical protein
VPARLIREIYAAAPGNEMESGKFGHPESSAALAANTFGRFLECPNDMPPIPGWERYWSSASSVSLETTLRFPWDQGRHPCLDVLVTAEKAVFAIESKRFEPYRKKLPAIFSNAYWRSVWGDRMDGYEFIRDMLKDCGTLFSRLDAAQLVKHALGLLATVHRDTNLRGKIPVLLYLYADPTFWPDGRPISPVVRETHLKELSRFAKCVAGSEVRFGAISYKELLGAWQSSVDSRVQNHASAVMRRYGI